MRVLAWIKNRLLSDVARTRQIRFGLYRGLTFELNLRSSIQLYLGLWERETYASLRSFTHRCDWAIDIGAGDGELIVYLLNRTNVQTVIAFDPYPPCLAKILQSIQINPQPIDGRFTLRQEFVGQTGQPDGVTLDSVVVPASQRGFIKIDVEGNELEVLQSGKHLLTSGPRDILVETHSLELEQQCFAQLQAMGFECRIISTAWWRPMIPEQREGHCRWLAASRG